MRHYSLLICATTLSVVAIILFCGELPSNPIEDPNNAGVRFFTESKNPSVLQGETLTIGLEITLSQHISLLRIRTSCQNLDTNIVPVTEEVRDSIYFNPQFTMSGSCTLFVSATLKKAPEKHDTLIVHVYGTDADIRFITQPSSHTIKKTISDTLLFVTKTTGTGVTPEYTIVSTPVVDSAHFFRIGMTAPDTIRIVFNPGTVTAYTISVIASTATNSGIEVKDTATLDIRVLASIGPSTIDIPKTITAGTIDTLIFSVDNRSREDRLTMQVITSDGKPLDNDLFTVLPSGGDSILIAITPSANISPGTVNIGIATTSSTIVDTSWYPIIIIGKKICTITFDGQGASVLPDPTSLRIDASSELGSLPTTPNRTGYFFDGWYTGINGTGSRVTTAMTFSSSATIYAKWIIKDLDNNIYTDVKIGNQVWMVENLKVTKYNDGTEIPYVKDASAWKKLDSGGFCWYDNNNGNELIYGGLYNWYAVNTKKLAPAGWHIPSNEEWGELENYLISNGYNQTGMKNDNTIAKSLAARIYWGIDSGEGTIGNDLSKNDASGFFAFPGGCRYSNQTFIDIGIYGGWWSTTESNSTSAWYRYLYYNNSTFGCSNHNKRLGFSVRCLRD